MRGALRSLAGWLLLLGLLLAPSLTHAEPAGVVITVLSKSGEALVGVRVSAIAMPTGKPEWETTHRLASCRTDAQGQAVLGGLDPQSPCALVATPPDNRWREFADFCKLGWVPKATSITLSTARCMRGTVRDPHKRAVPFAYVQAEVGPWKSGTYTDKEGGFVFHNAPPGTARLYAEVHEKSGPSVLSDYVNAPTDARNATLVLRSSPDKPKAYMTIRVYTPAGRPVMYGSASWSGRKEVIRGMGSSVSYTTSGGTVHAGAARTDDFDMPLKFEVVGARSEFGEWLGFAATRGGPFGPGPRAGKLTLEAGLPLTGFVYGPDELPLAGIRVAAKPKVRLSSGRMPQLGDLTTDAHGEGVTAADGSFRIEGLEKRDYEIEPVPTRTYVGGRGIEAKGGATDVKIHMHPSVNPYLTIVDEAGKPMANVVIHVKPVKSNPFFRFAEGHLEIQTGRDGRARLTGLDPKEAHELTVFPPTERSDLLPRKFRKWKPKEATIILEGAKGISGTVTDQDGEPVPNARLTWQYLGKGSEKPGKRRKGKTKPDGTFALENLRPGNYKILVKPPKGVDGQAAKANPKEIASGTARIRLQLDMADTLRLRLRAYTRKIGKPDIMLIAEGETGSGPSSVKKKVDKEGAVVFDKLRWDVSYTVYMGGLKNEKLVFEKGLKPQDRKLEMKLLSAQTLTGSIECPKGTSKKKVRVIYPGFEIKGKIKGGTKFEVSGLPPAPWTVRITGKKGKVEYTGETIAKTTDGIVVKLEPKP